MNESEPFPSEQIRKDLCALYLKLSEESPGEGNAGYFVRDSEGELLYIVVTPSGGSLAPVNHDDMVILDQNGIPLPYQKKPTSELPTYLKLGREMKRATAVGHEHEEDTVTLSCLLNPHLRTIYLYHYPQAHYVGGDGNIYCSERVAAQDVVASELAAEKVFAAFKDGNAALQSDHGAWAVGKNFDAVWLTLRTVRVNARRRLFELYPDQRTLHRWSPEEANIIRDVIRGKYGQDRKN